MRSTSFKKCLIPLLAGGCLFGDVSCIPNRDQFNATISSGILNGIQIAITLAIEEVLTPNIDLIDGDTTGTTDTTGETQVTE